MAVHFRDPPNALAASSWKSGLRVSRDREHGFQCIVSNYFAGS
jgi:hypothetical protein